MHNLFLQQSLLLVVWLQYFYFLDIFLYFILLLKMTFD